MTIDGSVFQTRAGRDEQRSQRASILGGASCGVRTSQQLDSPKYCLGTGADLQLFKKICLTCDFTVSGEISRVRAMRLLEQPWLIIARTSRSRAVSGSLTRLLGCAAQQAFNERWKFAAF